MAGRLDAYPVLRLQRLGTIVVVQPLWDGEVAGPSLTCDLETGTLALAEHPRIEKDYAVVHGVLGLERLEAGPALAVITGAEEVRPWVVGGGACWSAVGAVRVCCWQGKVLLQSQVAGRFLHPLLAEQHAV